MKKIVLLTAVCFVLFITQSKAEDVWDGSVAEAYAGGTGSENDPYQISNGAELAKLAQDVSDGNTFIDVFFMLTADITLNKGVIDENGELTKDSANLNVWIPIGDSDPQNSVYLFFRGTFDGNGHEINGVYVNSPGKKNCGLFGAATGVIKNLGITDSYIYGDRYCGGICGDFEGTISGCYNTGSVVGQCVGGICGIVSSSSNIQDCYNIGSVAGQNVGGICGIVSSSSNIQDCYNTGSLVGRSVGGICGSVGGSNIKNCYNTGMIRGINTEYSDYTTSGGIVGSIDNNGSFSSNVLSNCYNKGHVISNIEAGGIAGYSRSIMLNCYNEGPIEGFISGGICGYYGGYDKSNVYYMSNCYNVGAITSNYEGNEVILDSEIGTGGIVGISKYSAQILSCYNNGTVSGKFVSGGIVGKNWSYYDIKDCYNTASVEGDSCIGGIVGFNLQGSINNCYNRGKVNGKTYIGGIAGGWYSGDIAYCYYLKDENKELYGVNNEDVKGLVEGFTEDEFKSGKVTWLLNQKSSIDGISKWFQNIDGNDTGAAADAYPVLDPTHGMVYATGECYNHITSYSNTYMADIPAHTGENGICKYCGIVIPVEPLEVDGFYQIGNIGELYWFAGLANGTLGGVGDRNSNARAVLTDNIVVNEKVLDENGLLTSNSASLLPWEPIGSKYKRFSGSLDGQGHVISGIYCNAPDKDYQGLFGNLYEGNISNLGIEDCYIVGASYVGCLAGSTHDTEILNCYSTGTVNGRSAVGGLTGYSFYNNAYMRNCYFGGNVIGQSTLETGNITGYCEAMEYVLNCYYVRKPENMIGGINGYIDLPGNIVGRSEEDFASGEIAWLLNNKETENAVWRQNINTSGLPNDITPTLDVSHQMVYPVYNCPIDIIGYSNTAQTVIPDHKTEDGLCIYCGEIVYTEPELINDYYQISNVGELYWFAALVNGTLEGVEKNNAANAILVNDITINRLEFVEDETGVSVYNSRFSWNPIHNFIGTFDGNNHHIKGLYINKTNSVSLGLFGTMGRSGGILKNIFLSESYIKGDECVGGIAGYISSSNVLITNCHSDSYIIGTNRVGGIVGESSCRIEKCSNHGRISGEERVGGIVGISERDSILICYNAGTVTGTDRIGGIAGENQGLVDNCYNMSSINGESSVGGIVGNMLVSSEGVFNCHNTGKITGTTSVGSIIGSKIFRIIPVGNCYYVNDGDAVGGINGNDVANQAEGRSSDEFANGTVYALLNGEGNNGIWYQEMGKDLYPVLDFFVATAVQEAPQINEGETVDVYDMKGLLLRKNVDKENALSGLPAGIYIVNNKKVILEP